MKWLSCFKVHGLRLANGTWSCSVPAGSRHSPGSQESSVYLGNKQMGKVSSGTPAGSLPGTAEDADLRRLITKGDTCCVDPLCRALLNTIALVGTRPGWRTALVSQLLSYKCGEHPYSSWASKEKSNFLNAVC